MASYVHKLLIVRCKTRSCINLIYAHYQLSFPTTQQNMCITQSYGMFIYRTQSHLAQTPHSSPDQLKVTQSRNSTRDFESSAGESGVHVLMFQRNLWLPSTELRWKQQVPLKRWNTTASIFMNLDIWDLKLPWLPISETPFQRSATAHFSTTVSTSPDCPF